MKGASARLMRRGEPRRRATRATRLAASPGSRRSFSADFAARELVGAEDQGVASAAGVGLLELRLHAARPFGARGVHLHRQAGGAQRLARHHRDAAALRGRERSRRRRRRRRGIATPTASSSSSMRSMPMPQPTAGRPLAAELLEQAVVAAAAADGALRAEAVGHPLEDGQVVVVEAAHQARVDAVRRARRRRARRARRRSARATRRRGSPSAAARRRAIACIAGFLLSRMRSGLLCRRRRASSSSASACCSR